VRGGRGSHGVIEVDEVSQLFFELF